MLGRQGSGNRLVNRKNTHNHSAATKIFMIHLCYSFIMDWRWWISDSDVKGWDQPLLEEMANVYTPQIWSHIPYLPQVTCTGYTSLME